MHIRKQSYLRKTFFPTVRLLVDDINLYKVNLIEPSIIEHQISPEGLS